MWRYYLPLLGLAVLIGLFYVGLHGNPSIIPSPLIGKPAPAYELPSLQEPTRLVSDRSYRGRMHMLNVWATWCGGCRDEHPTLVEIARAARVPIVGLDWKDQRSLATRWLQEFGNPYADVAFDADGRVAIDWGVYGAPETFLISAEGKVLYKHIGPLTLKDWKEKFVPLIEGTGQPATAARQ
jgi:cytochrome c biogenesis protein CcmG/thiol:disulfide interchange protein DsbE